MMICASGIEKGVETGELAGITAHGQIPENRPPIQMSKSQNLFSDEIDEERGDKMIHFARLRSQNGFGTSEPLPAADVCRSGGGAAEASMIGKLGQSGSSIQIFGLSNLKYPISVSLTAHVLSQMSSKTWATPQTSPPLAFPVGIEEAHQQAECAQNTAMAARLVMTAGRGNFPTTIKGARFAIYTCLGRIFEYYGLIPQLEENLTTASFDPSSGSRYL